MKYTEKIFDIQTSEETFIEKDMTAEEIAKLEEIQTQQAEAEVKEAARQELLSRLGITEEEARILLGGN